MLACTGTIRETALNVTSITIIIAAAPSETNALFTATVARNELRGFSPLLLKGHNAGENTKVTCWCRTGWSRGRAGLPLLLLGVGRK